MILGLVVSTSITGATVMDYDGTIISCEAWRFQNKKNFPNLFSKAKFAKEQLSEIKKKYKIKEIYIEKSLQSFRSVFSSAKTLSTLASFNGIISWLCYELWGRQPEYISAPSARKTPATYSYTAQPSSRTRDDKPPTPATCRSARPPGGPPTPDPRS